MSEFPGQIEFQTFSLCNSRCQVCPMAWTADQLSHGKMSESLLERLLDELAAHADQLQSVEPYLNNEPFLDKRYLGVLRRVRAFHRGNVEVSTNASRLTLDLSRSVLEEGLIDDFRFSVFGACAETHERVMAGLDFAQVRSNIESYAELWNRMGRPNSSRIVFVHNPSLYPEGEVDRVRELWSHTGLGLTVWEQLDRLGNVPLPLDSGRRREGKVVHCKMGYMRDRVAIMYDGQVLLCCQDWGRSYLLGDLNSATLSQIWNSPERRNQERLIYDPEVNDPDHPCHRCELATIV